MISTPEGPVLTGTALVRDVREDSMASISSCSLRRAVLWRLLKAGRFQSVLLDLRRELLPQLFPRHRLDVLLVGRPLASRLSHRGWLVAMLLRAPNHSLQSGHLRLRLFALVFAVASI